MDITQLVARQRSYFLTGATRPRAFREAALRSAADYRATLRDVLRLIRIARGMGPL